MALSLEKTQKKRKQTQTATVSPKPSVRPWQKSTTPAKPVPEESQKPSLESDWNFAPLAMTGQEWKEQLDFLAQYGQQRLIKVKKSIKKLVRPSTPD